MRTDIYDIALSKSALRTLQDTKALLDKEGFLILAHGPDFIGNTPHLFCLWQQEAVNYRLLAEGDDLAELVHYMNRLKSEGSNT